MCHSTCFGVSSHQWSKNMTKNFKCAVHVFMCVNHRLIVCHSTPPLTDDEWNVKSLNKLLLIDQNSLKPSLSNSDKMREKDDFLDIKIKCIEEEIDIKIISIKIQLEQVGDKLKEKLKETRKGILK